MENGLDTFHQKRTRQPKPRLPSLYHDLRGGLATLTEMALVIWLFSQDQRSWNPWLCTGGGHKGYSAIDQAAQQIVETEITHLHQQTAIDLYLELWQCFDMMVEACLNLACHRHGADNAYLRLHAKMHQAMKYYVRHKFGISNDYNTFAAHPWHGAGQGAADATLQFIALSDMLISAYHTKVAPITMTDPTNNLTILRSLKAFINGIVLHVSVTPMTTYKTLKQKAQDQLHWWNKLIQVTRGSLNH